MTKRDCISKINSLLSYVREKVSHVAADKSEIFIFGAGNTANLYAKSFAVEKINPVAFLDNDTSKQVSRGGGGKYYLPKQFADVRTCLY